MRWLRACRALEAEPGSKQQEMGWGDGRDGVCVYVCVNSAGGLGRASRSTWNRIQGLLSRLGCQFGSLVRAEVAPEVQNDWSD